jgi:hypothetical protein
MRTWLRDHGLLVANLILFLGTFVGMIVSGAASYSSDQVQHHQAPVSLLQYLGTGDFLEATFENWESEFLQMGSYVVLTAFLFLRGSAESKPIDEDAPQDEDPRDARISPRTPWPVRRGGAALAVYEHSLAILFGLLFLGSVFLHALGGMIDYNEQQAQHGQSPVDLAGFLGAPEFWFQSMQNWQSEFMVVCVILVASIWLRQRGSSQSKPVAASSRQTGND